eukprot:scaffold34551_cov73-Phaeocystis_antarctica.AAC.1
MGGALGGGGGPARLAFRRVSDGPRRSCVTAVLTRLARGFANGKAAVPTEATAPHVGKLAVRRAAAARQPLPGSRCRPARLRGATAALHAVGSCTENASRQHRFAQEPTCVVRRQGTAVTCTVYHGRRRSLRRRSLRKAPCWKQIKTRPTFLVDNTTTSLEMRATVLTHYSICVLWFAACRPLETCVSFHWSVCVVSP